MKMYDSAKNTEHHLVFQTFEHLALALSLMQPIPVAIVL